MIIMIIVMTITIIIVIIVILTPQSLHPVVAVVLFSPV